MNRSDLINALKNKVALSRKDAGKVVDTFFDALKETLQKAIGLKLGVLAVFR